MDSTVTPTFALYHQEHIHAKLFLVIGAQQKQRVIDIKHQASNWGENVHKSLIGFHAFTGTDTQVPSAEKEGK